MTSYQPSVLVIDDQPGIVMLLQEVLTSQGLSVEAALNGHAAMAKVQLSQYDLILMDLRMPGISGFEILEQMRKQKINTPAWLMTAYGEFEYTSEQAKNLGICEILTKPFDVFNVARRICSYLNIEKTGS